MKRILWIAGAALVTVAIGCGRGAPGTEPVEIDASGGAVFDGRIFADSFQIYLHDASIAPDFSDRWTRATIADKFALGKNALAFCPLREAEVSVRVVVQSAPPSNDVAAWDHVVEGSIEITSGRLAVRGAADAQPIAVFRVQPAWYRARVHSGNLRSVRQNGVSGDDRYEVVLWPASEGPTRTLKKYAPGS